MNNFKRPCNAGYVKNFQNDISDVSKKETHDLSSNDLDIGSDSVDFFEIFGLKLYFDDILLICIIFFLYNEGVKDQGLFIALILLLLS